MSVRAAVLRLVALPAAVLLGAYVWLARDHGTASLLGVAVHENGRFTLAQTILYPRHFLREIPIALAYAAASVGSYRAYGPAGSAAPSRALRAAALGACVLLVAGGWLAAARSAGAIVATHEFLQMYVRDEEAPVPGAHWRYHLLSTLAYFCGAVVLAAVVRRWMEGGFHPPRLRPRARWLGGTLAAVVAVTVLLGLTRAPFLDPRHLGHAAREAVTHLSVTLPLSLALLVALGRPRPASPARAGERRPGRDVWVAAGAGTVVAAYLGLGTLARGAVAAARPGVALSSLAGAHVYEHGLDGLLVLLLTTALAPAARRASGR